MGLGGYEDDDDSPLSGSCASSAIVAATSQQAARVSSVVRAQAEDRSRLHCDVFVAPIYELEIFTTVERIDVNATETISVIAKDQHGNTFTTLQGLRFHWSASNTDILTIVRYLCMCACGCGRSLGGVPRTQELIWLCLVRRVVHHHSPS